MQRVVHQLLIQYQSPLPNRPIPVTAVEMTFTSKQLEQFIGLFVLGNAEGCLQQFLMTRSLTIELTYLAAPMRAAIMQYCTDLIEETTKSLTQALDHATPAHMNRLTEVSQFVKLVTTAIHHRITFTMKLVKSTPVESCPLEKSPDEILALLRSWIGSDDIEKAHASADNLLLEFLTGLGYEEIVSTYKQIGWM